MPKLNPRNNKSISFCHCIALLTLSLALKGCSDNANIDIYETTLKMVSRVKVDESDIVLTSYPNESILYGRDSVLSIVDYNLLVIYNTLTGAIANCVSIDTLMQGYGFDLLQYVQKNKAGIYRNRKYISSLQQVEEIADLPRYKVISLPSPPQSSIVPVLVGILTPYNERALINGDSLDAQFLERSTALIYIDLAGKRITGIVPVKTELLHYEKDHDQVFFPFFEGCALLKDQQLITTASANPESHTQFGEKVSFSLKSVPQSVAVSKNTYPEEYFTKYSKNINQFKINHNSDNTVEYNDLFSVYDITDFAKPKLRFCLKDKMDQHNLERINTFKKISENVYLIQTISQDSLRSCKFRFYDAGRRRMSSLKLSYPGLAPLEYVIYTSHGFIKFSKDGEYTYIEKYEISFSHPWEPSIFNPLGHRGPEE